MRLIIAEKNSVGRAIAAVIGIKSTETGYIKCSDSAETVVTWASGHMYQMAGLDEYTPPNVPLGKNGKKVWRFEELPVFPETWILNKDPGKREQTELIEELIGKADVVVNAGDPDREGQLLIDEIIWESPNKPKTCLRYWANAIDRKSIENALNNLKPNDAYQGMCNAAEYRRRADWLVGINLSRAYSIANHHLSNVGRVMTPTLQLVADRDLEIENFKPADYYELRADFGAYKGKFLPDELQEGTDHEGRLTDKSIADKISAECSGSDSEITSYSCEEKEIQQPLGLNLADITAAASAKFGFSAKRTLELCQSLYEMKFQSYPRTDSKYLPENQYADAASVLETIKRLLPDLAKEIAEADPSIHSRTWNTEKTTAHHAIIPVAADPSETDITQIGEDERKIFDLVCRNYIAQFYPVSRVRKTVIRNLVRNYTFEARGTIVENQGWKAVYDDSDDKKEELQELPIVREGDHVKCLSVSSQTKRTKAPPKFTEGSLIKAMANVYQYIDDPEIKKILRDGDGIGTSATRAAIIEKLKTKFIREEGKFIVSTPEGRNLLKEVSESLTSAVTTALWERDLSLISEGAQPHDFERRICDFVLTEVTKVKENYVPGEYKGTPTDFKCPECGKPLYSKKFSWCCDECGVKLSKEMFSYSLTDTDLKNALAGTGKVLDKKFKSLKTGKVFSGKIVYKKESKNLSIEFENRPLDSKYKCPRCGKPLMRLASKIMKGSFWWCCSGYPNCKLKFKDANGKPMINEEKKQ